MKILFGILCLFLAVFPIANGLPNFTVYGAGSGLTGDVVSTMAANPRTIWVNSWYPTTQGQTGGLSTFSYKYENWTTYARGDGLAADTLQGIGIDPQDRVWICHSQGVQVFDPATEGFVANYGAKDGLKGAAMDVAFQGDGFVWVATTEGLGKFDRSAGKWSMVTESDGLVHNKVYSIAVDEDMLWIGTAGGACRYETTTSQWLDYTTEDGLPDDIVNKVAVTSSHVWFATRGGLSRMKKSSGKINSFYKEDGLPSNNILDVAVFRERVWVATSDGVGKYEGKWRIVDASDGLPVTNVYCIAAQRDYIWFGTPSGVARYGPIGPGLSFGSPYFIILVLAVVGGAALVIVRPGGRRAKGDERERRPKPRPASRQPPYEVCGGVPQRPLCTRCKFYTLKGDTLRCAKYGIALSFKDEGDSRLKQIKRSPVVEKPEGDDSEEGPGKGPAQ